MTLGCHILQWESSCLQAEGGEFCREETVTFKAVTLKVAAVCGDMLPIFPSQADLQLLMPHVKYHAWLVTDTFLLSYSKVLTAVFMVNTIRDFCLDHKMYV